MTMRLSTMSLAGTARTDVAVGTWMLASMFVTTRAAGPRSFCTSSVAWSSGAGAPATLRAGTWAYGAVAGWAVATGRDACTASTAALTAGSAGSFGGLTRCAASAAAEPSVTAVGAAGAGAAGAAGAGEPFTGAAAGRDPFAGAAAGTDPFAGAAGASLVVSLVVSASERSPGR